MEPYRDDNFRAFGVQVSTRRCYRRTGQLADRLTNFLPSLDLRVFEGGGACAPPRRLVLEKHQLPRGRGRFCPVSLRPQHPRRAL
jgi:hypothetical protein